MTSARALVLLSLAVAAVKFELIWSGWPETSLLADDAFYYFTIARNMAAGLGPTFDGLAPTNGFHPAWQLLLVPLFDGSYVSAWEPIRWALALTVVFDLLSAWLLWLLVRRAAGSGAALAASAFFLVAAPSALIGLRGMEASLSCSLMLALMAVLFVEPPRLGGPLPRAVVIGVLLGLCGWARTDQILTVGAATAFVLLWKAKDATLAVRARRLGGVGAAAGAVLYPWFHWNWATFGTLVQSSAQAPRLARSFASDLPSDVSSVTASLDTAASAAFPMWLESARWLCGEEFQGSRLWPWLASATLLGLLPLAVMGIRELRRDPAQRLHVFALAYLVAHTAAFGLFFRAYWVWYALPSLAMFALLVGSSLPQWVRGSGRARFAFLACWAILLAVQPVSYALYAGRVAHGAGGAERSAVGRLERVAQASEGSAIWGAWDAGALGYFAAEYPDIVVVNLDGVVNDAVLQAVREGLYADYLLHAVDGYLQPPRRARIFLSEDEYHQLLTRVGLTVPQ